MQIITPPHSAPIMAKRITNNSLIIGTGKGIANGALCQICREGFDSHEPILNSQGETYHEDCLV
jgi:hypothetical protein